MGREFHIRKEIRDQYQLTDSLFELDGNVVFSNIQAIKKFIQQITEKMDPVTIAEKNLTTPNLYAMGLIDEILHYVLHLYRKEMNPEVLQQAWNAALEAVSKPVFEKTLTQFCEIFPPKAVYQKSSTVAEYLSDDANRVAAFEEMILLWLANVNPAFLRFDEFFDDSELRTTTAYLAVIDAVKGFVLTQPVYGPDYQDIITMLRAPAVHSPYSLQGQLQFIRERWAEMLGDFLNRLLTGIDLIVEESKPRFGGPGLQYAPDYALLRGWLDLDQERFSEDRDWMSRLVLIAKNTYVWLFQLSQKYHREINRLDQIPDEELVALARNGFTGLWLIGLWERSPASARIKQMCGNPEAVSSAYSIYEYQIASDLGGQSALDNLKYRANLLGIRLASDMVPNHMGIDSRAVVEKPDQFLSLPYPPYPAYTFDGPDLSSDPNVGIYLEDHYYTRSDASVVFKRWDKNTGDTRYIYHGNDGTTMPWNDTAQLNYLLPVVREDIIRVVLDVARSFQIIRFDAAMTLAKKHYQRLWFPAPGTGGAIPSRTENTISQQDFDAAFPVEFWRDVVDTVAREVPDTLLLAEAFWLMESYFVRTLGMHRVYNSAFMNMLRNEDNANYRKLIQNTIEFDPEILKRLVNFMNNPDEKTAVEQFGKGDKYFGICVLMSTLPGLPMFGHGQMEGYAEKYGMEYRRAYLNETIDEDLFQRHQREITPLLERRYIYSGAENFRMYDFRQEDGSLIEDVFAYSNSFQDQFSLVLFHNRFGTTAGRIKTSTGFLDKATGFVRTEALSAHIHASVNPGEFTICTDVISGMDYLLKSDSLVHEGMYFELNAYEYHVLVNFHQVDDTTGDWEKLYWQYQGRPIHNIYLKYRQIHYQKLQNAFSELLAGPVLEFLSGCTEEPDVEIDIRPKPFGKSIDLEQKVSNFVAELYSSIGFYPTDVAQTTRQIMVCAATIRSICTDLPPAPLYPSKTWRNYSKYMKKKETGLLPIISRWSLVVLGILEKGLPFEALSALQESLVRHFGLDLSIQAQMITNGLNDWEANWQIRVLEKWMQNPVTFYQPEDSVLVQFTNYLTYRSLDEILGVNESDGIRWFRGESMDAYLHTLTWMMLIAIGPSPTIWAEKVEMLNKYKLELDRIHKMVKKSSYKLDDLIKLISSELRA